MVESPEAAVPPLPPSRERGPPRPPLDLDDLLAENNLRPALETTGWHVDEYEDAAHHFLARAVLRA
ncbi:hypothetical protein [Streptomyces sp. NPDC058579]|uniref:hypothetical protein n=1 Tax=Streptomyces sp. NPDC058579 TaxID=3346548 RepID=UPI00365D1C84